MPSSDLTQAKLARDLEVTTRFTQRNLFRTIPAEIPRKSFGGTLFLVTALKRLATKRYDDLRRDTIARARAYGKKAPDGRLYLRAGGFSIPIAVTVKGLLVADKLAALLTARGMRESRIATIVVPTKAGTTKCAHCGGTGKIPGDHLRINERELEKILNAEILPRDDVYVTEYRLGDIQPPAALREALEALGAAAGTEHE